MYAARPFVVLWAVPLTTRSFFPFDAHDVTATSFNARRFSAIAAGESVVVVALGADVGASPVDDFELLLHAARKHNNTIASTRTMQSVQRPVLGDPGRLRQQADGSADDETRETPDHERDAANHRDDRQTRPKRTRRPTRNARPATTYKATPMTNPMITAAWPASAHTTMLHRRETSGSPSRTATGRRPGRRSPDGPRPAARTKRAAAAGSHCAAVCKRWRAATIDERVNETAARGRVGRHGRVPPDAGALRRLERVAIRAKRLRIWSALSSMPNSS